MWHLGLNLWFYITTLEKIGEAARKFAALQSDLSSAVTVSDRRKNAKSGLRHRRQSEIVVPNDMLDKKKTRKSMHDIKLAFSEFYLSLILLQNYQTLNFTGFRKILKKHDKVINMGHISNILCGCT